MVFNAFGCSLNWNILAGLEGKTVEFKMVHDDDSFEPILFTHVIDKTGWDGVLNEAAIQLARECGPSYADVLIAQAHDIEPRIMLESHLQEADNVDDYANIMWSNLIIATPKLETPSDFVQKLARALCIRKRIAAAFEDDDEEASRQKRQRRDAPSDGRAAAAASAADGPVGDPSGPHDDLYEQ